MSWVSERICQCVSGGTAFRLKGSYSCDVCQSVHSYSFASTVLYSILCDTVEVQHCALWLSWKLVDVFAFKYSLPLTTCKFIW